MTLLRTFSISSRHPNILYALHTSFVLENMILTCQFCVSFLFFRQNNSSKFYSTISESNTFLHLHNGVWIFAYSVRIANIENILLRTTESGMKSIQNKLFHRNHCHNFSMKFFESQLKIGLNSLENWKQFTAKEYNFEPT